MPSNEEGWTTQCGGIHGDASGGHGAGRSDTYGKGGLRGSAEWVYASVARLAGSITWHYWPIAIGTFNDHGDTVPSTMDVYNIVSGGDTSKTANTTTITGPQAGGTSQPSWPSGTPTSGSPIAEGYQIWLARAVIDLAFTYK